MFKVQVNDKDIEMLITGEKPFLCIDESDFFNRNSNTILCINESDFSNRNSNIICLVDRNGDAVGTAYVYQYSDVLYNSGLSDEEWFISRNDALQEVYSLWCEYKGIQPLHNGWLESVNFNNYLNTVGWGGDYILYLTDIKINKVSKVV